MNIKTLKRLGLVGFGIIAGLGTNTGTKAVTPGPNGATYDTRVVLVNMGDSAATPVISFYGKAGNLVKDYPVAGLSPGQLALVTIGNSGEVTDLPADQYAMVVSDNNQIAALASSYGTKAVPGGTAVVRDTYAGFDDSKTATTLFAPSLFNNYYSLNANIVVQNTEANPTVITVRVYNNAGAQIISKDISIAGNGYAVYDATAEGLPSGNNNDTGGLMSAKITSSATKIAAIVNMWADKGGANVDDLNKPLLAQYSMLNKGETKLFVPKAMKNYYGLITSVNVQNVGTDNAAVTIRYYLADGALKHTVNANIKPGQTLADYPFTASTPLPGSPDLNNRDWSGAGIFSAVVESTNGQPIICVVHENDLSEGSYGAYASYGASSAATTLYAPLMYKNFTGFGGKLFGSLVLQNTDASSPASVKVTSTKDGLSKTYAIPANGGQVAINYLDGGATTMTDNSYSALKIESLNGQAVLAVVGLNDIAIVTNNLGTNGLGDSLSDYNPTK